MLAAQTARFVLQIGSIAALTRLLSPAEVGLVAMVTAVLNVAEIIRDFGLSSAAVQAPTLSREQQSNLFWLNLGLGGVCSIGAAALAPLIAWGYGQHELVGIVLALAGVFVISGANTQYRADLTRRLRFGALAVTDLTAQVLATAVAVTSAALGAGYWALVAQQGTMAVTALLVSVGFCRWGPCRPRRDVPMRGFLRFGGHLLGTNMLGYALNNLDNVGVGAVWGPGPLGLYSRAYQLLQQPLQQATVPLSRVALPVLARVQDDEALYLRFFQHLQLGVCYLFGVGFAVLAGLAQPLTDVLLGAQWMGVAPILAVLAVAGVFKGMDSANYQIWVSRGLTGQLFRFYLISRPAMIVIILAGLPWGPLGVAAGHLVAAIAHWLVGTRLVCRYAGLPLRPLVVRPVQVLLLVALPAGAVTYAASQLPLGAASVLGIGVAAGLAVTALTSAAISPLRRDAGRLLSTMVSSIRRRRTTAN